MRSLRFTGWLLWLLPFMVPAQADTMVVATYNIENYTGTNRRIDEGFRPDYPKPEQDKLALRTVIKSMNADVLVLQEVGGTGYLKELQLDLKTEGVDYPYGHVLEGADPERCVGVLSRVPFAAVVDHTDLAHVYFGETVLVKRGLLEVSFDREGGRLALFVVHLKSRLTNRKDDYQSVLQRNGEAVAVRDRVLERYPNPAQQSFMVLGDFNDLRPNRPLRAILDRGKTRICEWLPAADSRGETWTYYYARNEVYSRVDHILVSPAAQALVQKSWIVDTPETSEASDHRPLVVELKW